MDIGIIGPRCYAGVGSRRTPPDVLTLMTNVARFLDAEGFTLRSGGADGADLAFERGTTQKQIFYPYHAEAHAAALATVDQYHPAPQRLSDYARLLMARNAFQVLGPNLDDPVEFVICWTPDGAVRETSYFTGGTGQAIRTAVAHGIPVVNLARPRLRKAVELRIGYMA